MSSSVGTRLRLKQRFSSSIHACSASLGYFTLCSQISTKVCPLVTVSSRSPISRYVTCTKPHVWMEYETDKTWYDCITLRSSDVEASTNYISLRRSSHQPVRTHLAIKCVFYRVAGGSTNNVDPVHCTYSMTQSLNYHAHPWRLPRAVTT